MVRAAAPNDVPRIHALILELARYEKLEDEAVVTAKQLASSLFGSSMAHAEAIVADAGKEGVVGFALFFHNYSTFLGRRGLYLEDLFVVPAHRRKGYGKALLREVARLAVARGCGRFEWAVLQWNEPAIRFYRSLGAQEMSDWRIFRLTGDALLRAAK